MTPTSREHGRQLADDVARLCAQAASLGGGSSYEAASRIRSRLDEPLRVAIAGRVKAGKSTLLNALVGERLAPTDAGECTHIVTWYRHGPSYAVHADLHEGDRRELRFRRDRGPLEIDLGLLDAAEIRQLNVAWPAGRLSAMTLVDTPGLESLTAEAGLRTHGLLEADESGASQVDAVVYLMKHLHRSDATFLEAFRDDSLARPSPVNAIAVLSRADELGAGRLDALDSAQVVADRYASDDAVRVLCATVVPVAGLLAETGLTLTEDEADALRQLTGSDPDELGRMLLSVEQFCTPGVSPLTVEVRRGLLVRLGLFGVRFSIRELSEGRALTAMDLSRRLVHASGLEELVSLLDGHIGRRSQVLKARSALLGLRRLADEMATASVTGATELAAAIERVQAGAHDLAELRLLHLVMTGAIPLSDEDRREIALLTAEGSARERLGLAPNTPDQELRATALARLEGWRTRAAHPLTDRRAAMAYDIVTSTYERLLATLSDGTTGS